MPGGGARRSLPREGRSGSARARARQVVLALRASASARAEARSPFCRTDTDSSVLRRGGGGSAESRCNIPVVTQLTLW